MCLNSACDGKIISDAIFISPNTIVILASALLFLPMFSLLRHLEIDFLSVNDFTSAWFARLMRLID